VWGGLQTETLKGPKTLLCEKLCANLGPQRDNAKARKATAEAPISMPVTKAAFRENSEELARSQDMDFFAVLRPMEEAAGIPGGSHGAD
jgi:hypothetical protein